MADDLKKKLVQYGDKVLFGLFLVVLIAVAALTLLSSKGPQGTTDYDPGRFKEPTESVADRIAKVNEKFVQGGIPAAYITGEFASDPDEVYPRAGEVACEDCGWIMPEKVLRCPNCGKWRANDDDKDGMPNNWEDRYKPVLDRYTPDADKDPDGDGFSNIKEYLGGSDPTDKKSIPSPFRLTNNYRRPIDVRFKGYIVKAGGDAKVIDADFWDLQMNFGSAVDMAVIPLGGYYRGYRLWPLEKGKIKIDPGGGIPVRWDDIYVLTIQRRGQQPIRLVQDRWARTNETYVDLMVTQGSDNGKTFEGLSVGDTIPANGTTFEIYEMHTASESPEGNEPFKLLLKGSEGEIYTLSE